jgi:RNA-directed DNA polymerase
VLFLRQDGRRGRHPDLDFLDRLADLVPPPRKHRHRLPTNLEKSRIVPADGVEFLGCGVTGTIHVSEKNVQKCERRIRELTGRSRGISMTQRLGELRRYLQGWAGYFALAKQVRLFENLDQWIRRRLRMCFWKRWRLVRTRVRNLLALGVPRRQAFRHTKSRQGPWHMAENIASGGGMKNA